ncbi:MAG: TylF/MycF family methyltransferase [Lachnospiraceae bacterium]|nr:TylF/MycF family methyltransferase [Lachnospiraceae bacterium]
MEKIVIYGCGHVGKEVLSWLSGSCERKVVAYIDSKAGDETGDLKCMGVSVLPPDSIEKIDFDYVFLAVVESKYALEMRQTLIHYKVPKSKIIDMSLCGYRDIRYYFIRGFADYVNCEKLEGSVAECGVNQGDSAMYINLAFGDRKLYLFDTFEGFDEGDLNYERNIGNQDFMEGQFNRLCFQDAGPNVKMEEVKRKMTYSENVVIKKGYFPDTAKDVTDKFCFVNLDMDLYIPILNGLRFFWDRMVSGGGIMVHDYFRPDLPGVKKAIEDFETERGIRLVKTPIGDGCSIFIVK